MSHIYRVADIADALHEQVTKTDRPVEALSAQVRREAAEGA